jgi:glyoxylase-like metal-dependent hydrolase (beta-lactamase superfamily II)
MRSCNQKRPTWRRVRGCDDGPVTEPKAVAARVEDVVPGVWAWSVHDDRINFVSASYAVSTEGGTVLIDPLPLADEPMKELGDVSAICLTTSSHQRSSWRLRRELGVEVWVPALARLVEEEPDERYSEGDTLPGDLRPVFTPGAGTTQHTFLLDRDGGIAFVPDLLVLPPGGELTLIPEQYAHDVEQARRSVQKLLDLPFAVLCLGHGAPVRDDAKSRIENAIARRRASVGLGNLTWGNPWFPHEPPPSRNGGNHVIPVCPLLQCTRASRALAARGQAPLRRFVLGRAGTHLPAYVCVSLRSGCLSLTLGQLKLTRPPRCSNRLFYLAAP